MNQRLIWLDKIYERTFGTLCVMTRKKQNVETKKRGQIDFCFLKMVIRTLDLGNEARNLYGE